MKASRMDTRKAGKLGGQARARHLTPAQRSEASRQTVRARWIERPVLAVRHSADGTLVEGWPVVGTATTWPEAVRLVRQAGYRVPSRRTPGYTWDLVPAAVAETPVDAFGVPAITSLLSGRRSAPTMG